MPFVPAKGDTDKPRKPKSYRKIKVWYKKGQVTKQTISISDTNQHASDSDLCRKIPRNMFKHFGFFSLAKYEPISLGDRTELQSHGPKSCC